MEQGSPAISVEIEGGTKHLIIDTGSSMSILQPGVLKHGIGVTAIKPYEITKKNLDIQGQQCVSFVLGKKNVQTHIPSVPLPTKAHGLLGSDFLRIVSAVINFDSRELSLDGSKKRRTSVLTGPQNTPFLQYSPKKNWKLISLSRNEGRKQALVGIN
jgi:hypothetical protein